MASSLDTVIRSRRTHKRFTAHDLDPSVVDELIELGIHAPCHRMTQPWRFAVLDRAGIARFSDWLGTQPQIAAWPDPAKGPAKLEKLRTHYLANLSALIQVTAVRDHDDAHRDCEDRDAVSAAVQNILLGATARGLASFWSSSNAMRHPDTLRWFGADPEQEAFVASIWLGQPECEPKTPQRLPLADVVRRP